MKGYFDDPDEVLAFQTNNMQQVGQLHMCFPAYPGTVEDILEVLDHVAKQQQVSQKALVDMGPFTPAEGERRRWRKARLYVCGSV